MTEPSRLRHDLPVFVALCVVDALRWLAWWLVRLLVQWGAAQCGFQGSADCRAEVPRPRTLRHDISLRREVRRGLAQIDDYLSAVSLGEEASQSSDDQIHRTRSEGGDG